MVLNSRLLWLAPGIDIRVLQSVRRIRTAVANSWHVHTRLALGLTESTFCHTTRTEYYYFVKSWFITIRLNFGLNLACFNYCGGGASVECAWLTADVLSSIKVAV